MPPERERWLETGAVKASLGRKTVVGGTITAAARTGRGLVDVAATVILARLLTPSDYGLLGMVVSVTSFIALFKDLGLSMATVQKEELTHAQVSQLFWLNLALGAALAAITAASAPGLAWFFDEARLASITLALSGAFVLSGASIQHEALLQRQMLQGRLAAVEGASILLASAAGVALALGGAGVWALVAQAVLLPLVRLGGVWVACSWRPSRPRRGVAVAGLLRFGGNVTGFRMVNYLARNLDDILIGRVLGKYPLGLYQQAYRLLMIPLRQINAPIASVAVPALSRLANEPERYRRAYRRIIEKVLLLTMPLGAVMIGTADALLETVLGAQWVPAADIFRWLGLLMFIQPLANSTGWLFMTQDRTKEMLRWGLVGSALTVVSFFAGLPYGAEGVAAAYAVSGVLVRMPLLVWWVGRRGHVSSRDLFQIPLPFVLCGALALAAAFAARRVDALAGLPPGGLLVAVASATLAVYAAGLFALPSGRAALSDVRVFLRELRSPKR
jgi:PST family polysaccharide transporter